MICPLTPGEYGLSVADRQHRCQVLSDVSFPCPSRGLDESKAMFVDGARSLIDQVRLKWLRRATCTRISSNSPGCEGGGFVDGPR